MNAGRESLLVLDRQQRLMLLAAAALWLLAAAAYQRRDWQDEWILADILLPYVGFVVVSAIVLLMEPDDKVVAIASSTLAAVLLIIPAVKYVQPYGITVDAVTHLQTVATLLQDGHMPPSATYAAIPGMHAVLVEAGLLSGLSAESLIIYVLPLVNALMPLFMYFLMQRTGMPAETIKPTVLLACLAVVPGFRPNGSAFAILPLFLVLSAVVLCVYYSSTRHERAAYCAVAILGIGQIVIWHSTTPFMLFLALLLASLSPWLIGRRLLVRPRWVITAEIALFALLTLVVTVIYHWIVNDRVWLALVYSLQVLTATEQEIVSAVPRRIFEIGLLDRAAVAFVIHGRDAMLAACAAAGCLVILFHRKQWSRQMPLYAFFLLSAIAFCMAVLYSVGGAGYRRFTLAPIAISPLFAAPLFWWTPQFKRGRILLPRLALPARGVLAVMLLAAWTAQVYVCQPLVPAAKNLVPGGSDDTLLWLQEVNTRYQKQMLYFVGEHAEEKTPVAADIMTKRQYERYFGPQAVSNHRFFQIKRQDQWLPTSDVDLVLLHRPGRAGSYGEQVEIRSADAIDAWRQRRGFNLVYDNGHSFVLNKIRRPQDPTRPNNSARQLPRL
jgi:hypothetical protein